VHLTRPSNRPRSVGWRVQAWGYWSIWVFCSAAYHEINEASVHRNSRWIALDCGRVGGCRTPGRNTRGIRRPVLAVLGRRLADSFDPAREGGGSSEDGIAGSSRLSDTARDGVVG